MLYLKILESNELALPMNKLNIKNVRNITFPIFIIFIKIILILIFAYLPLSNLSIKYYLIKTDFTGSFNLIDDPVKFFISANENNFGRYMLNPSSSIFFIYLKIIYIFFTPKIATFFAFYLNILSSLILIYLLIKEVLGKYKNFIIQLCISVIFIYSPIYLYHLVSVATLTFIMSINGLILFLLLYEKYRKSKITIYLYLIPLVSLLIVHPFVFTFYLVIISWFFIIDQNYKELFLIYPLIFLLNVFWIFPFLYSFYSQNSHTVINESTNVLISVNSSYAQLIKSFIFSPRDLNILPAYEGILTKPVIILYLLLWIITIVKLSYSKNKKKFYIFTLILIFTLFSLGHSKPLGGIYQFLINNFAFFSFFRSFLNVNLINLLMLLYLFTQIYKIIRKKNLINLYLIFFAVIISLTTFNVSQNSKFSPKLNIPEDYFKLQNFINNQKNDFYFLFIPFTRYKEFSWGHKDSGLNMIHDFFNRGIITNYEGEDYLQKKEGEINIIFNKKNYKNIPKYLGKNSIRYVVFDKSLISTIRYQKGSENYLTILSKLSPFGLKLIISNNFFNVYKVDDYLFFPKIIGEKIEFKKINPSKYLVNITMSNNSTIYFNANYYDGWNLYIQKTEPDKCNKIAFYIKEINLTECYSLISEFPNINEIGYLFKQSDFVNIRDNSPHPFNKWNLNEDIIKRKIDHEQLKQEGYPKKTVNGALDWKYYIQNPDRSITITLLLYEHNQVLLLLTFIITVISGISLFILILLMVFKKYFSPKNLVPYNDK